MPINHQDSPAAPLSVPLALLATLGLACGCEPSHDVLAREVLRQYLDALSRGHRVQLWELASEEDQRAMPRGVFLLHEPQVEEVVREAATHYRYEIASLEVSGEIATALVRERGPDVATVMLGRKLQAVDQRDRETRYRLVRDASGWRVDNAWSEQRAQITSIMRRRALEVLKREALALVKANELRAALDKLEAGLTSYPGDRDLEEMRDELRGILGTPLAHGWTLREVALGMGEVYDVLALKAAQGEQGELSDAKLLITCEGAHARLIWSFALEGGGEGAADPLAMTVTLDAQQPRLVSAPLQLQGYVLPDDLTPAILSAKQMTLSWAPQQRATVALAGVEGALASVSPRCAASAPAAQPDAGAPAP